MQPFPLIEKAIVHVQFVYQMALVLFPVWRQSKLFSISVCDWNFHQKES